MKKIPITFTIVVLIAYSILFVPAQSISAQIDDLSLDPVDITIELHENEISTMHFRARLLNIGSTAISEVDINIESLDMDLRTVTVDGEDVAGTLQRFDRYSIVHIPFTAPLEANASFWISIQGDLNDAQVDNGFAADGLAKIWDFVFYVRPSMSYGNFSLTVVLPEDATLSKDSVVPLYPESNLNFTDGQSMGFTWNATLIQAGQARVFIAKFQIPIPVPTPILSIILYAVIAGFIGLTGGLLIAGFGTKAVRRIRQIGKVKVVGITSEEEEVLDAIRLKGGACSQKELYTSLDLSQSKISLILTNLEERNLVRRMREGRENTVHICEE